ncbi:stress response protein NST1-like [Benincasa hispida]|uniref:stress response protein NST1-like n=1 Tax=Benincasa hispida TaxID=102211 RepID=UPI0019014D3A|nr:stress response protein NST1-like [Benincasa hispida]
MATIQTSCVGGSTPGSDDKEDPDMSPLMRRCKENAPQGSTRDPIIQERKEKETNNSGTQREGKGRKKRKLEDKDEKMARAHQIIASANLARRLHDEEVRRDNIRVKEEEKRKLEDEQCIALASEKFEKEMREEEEAEKKAKKEKELCHKANN